LNANEDKKKERRREVGRGRGPGREKKQKRGYVASNFDGLDTRRISKPRRNWNRSRQRSGTAN